MTLDYPTETKQRLALLQRLRVVLVSPKFPGNLGMTARAMKNCGCHDLHLVAPRAELNKEAYLLAPSAADVLDDATIVPTLIEAIADRTIVIGTSRRKGHARRNALSPEDAADMIRAAIPANHIALVFGAEDNGLDNHDLALCHWTVTINTGVAAESFNLSHAAAVLLYLVNRAVVAPHLGPKRLVRAIDFEAMIKDGANFLIEIGFLHESDPKRMMILFRSILHRAALTAHEVATLRGVLRQARWRIKNPTAPLVTRDAPIALKKELLRKLKAQKNHPPPEK